MSLGSLHCLSLLHCGCDELHRRGKRLRDCGVCFRGFFVTNNHYRRYIEPCHGVILLSLLVSHLSLLARASVSSVLTNDSIIR